MTPRHDLAELAARALATESDSTSVASDAQDAQAIARVAAAIRARRTHERRWRWILVGVAAAAAVIVAAGLGRRGTTVPGSIAGAEVVHPSPSTGAMLGVVDSVLGEAYVLHGGQAHSVVPGTTVGEGDQIVVQHAAGVAFGLPTGTRVTVDGGGDVTVLAQSTTQMFRLAGGSMRADVRKLEKGQRFIVRTLDAEIEVHGTSFRVASSPPDPSCGGGTTTRLSVYEGVVTVRAGSREAAVPAGQVWPAGCSDDAATDAPRAPTPASSSMSSGLRAGGSPPAPRSASAVAFTQSQLAEQNDLYARAAAARRDGHRDLAVAALEQLLARHPSGPLAEDAHAERMELLAPVDLARAAEEARAYVARYPSGFARAEAEAILAKQAGPR
jgi:hypothetical protein